MTSPGSFDLLKKFIIFAEREEELQKYILAQHQTEAVEKVVRRAHEPGCRRGLIWHTQGSGKTFTMIKAAELLFKAPESEKPTILMMIDRNELEDQLMKNLAALGLQNLEHAHSMAPQPTPEIGPSRNHRTTIHKFRDLPPA